MELEPCASAGSGDPLRLRDAADAVADVPPGERVLDKLLSSMEGKGVKISLAVVRNMKVQNCVPFRFRFSSHPNTLQDVLLWRHDLKRYAFLDADRASQVVGPRPTIDLEICEIEDGWNAFPPRMCPPTSIMDSSTSSSRRSQVLPVVESMPLPTFMFNLVCDHCDNGCHGIPVVANIMTRIDRCQDGSLTNSMTHVNISKLLKPRTMMDIQTSTAASNLAAHFHFCLSSRPKYIHHIPAINPIPDGLNYGSETLRAQVNRLRTEDADSVYRLHVPDSADFEYKYEHQVCYDSHFATLEFHSKLKIVVVFEGLMCFRDGEGVTTSRGDDRRVGGEVTATGNLIDLGERRGNDLGGGSWLSEASLLFASASASSSVQTMVETAAVSLSRDALSRDARPRRYVRTMHRRSKEVHTAKCGPHSLTNKPPL